MTKEDVIHRFTYHAPTPERVLQHEQMRQEGLNLALLLLEKLPDCRERSLAMIHLEEVVFWANAAIARNT